MVKGETLVKLMQLGDDNVIKSFELVKYVEEEFGFKEITQNDLVLAFSEENVSKAVGNPVCSTYSLMGDKYLDACLYELLVLKYGIVNKGKLDDFRKTYTTKEWNQKKLRDLDLEKYILLDKTNRALGDLKVGKEQADSTFEALIYFIKKREGLESLNTFVDRIYQEEIVNVTNDSKL